MEVRRQPWVLVVAFLHVLFTAAYARPPGLWASWGSSGSTSHPALRALGFQICTAVSSFTWFLGSALKSAFLGGSALLTELSLHSNTYLTFLHLSTISAHKKMVETYHKINRSTTITQVLPPKGNLCPDSWDHDLHVPVFEFRVNLIWSLYSSVVPPTVQSLLMILIPTACGFHFIFTL